MADLADLIIDHGPYDAGHLILASFASSLLNPDKLNTLREELIELRRLRAAAEPQRFTLTICAFRDGEGASAALWDARCMRAIAEYDDEPGGPQLPLAELVRPAGEHAEVCR